MSDTKAKKDMQKAPDDLTKTITISIAEYVYLNRIDALMDAVANDTEYYSNSQTVRSVIDAVRKMRGECDKAGAEV